MERSGRLILMEDLISFGASAFPPVVFRISKASEERFELFFQIISDRRVFADVNEVVVFAGVGFHVVQFVRSERVPKREFPLWGTNHAGVFELVVDHIFPGDCFSVKGGRKTFPGQRR